MAKAAVTNARQAFNRAQALLKTSAGTQKALDDAEAALRTARPANSAETRLARRKVCEPGRRARSSRSITGRARWCRPGGRWSSLLPPGNIKVRFFVPEAVLPKSRSATRSKSPAMAAQANRAKVSFIARTAEYTPPVIYSQEERAKLVFLIEARPRRPANCASASRSPSRCAEPPK